MISYLKGKVVLIKPNFIILSILGIGYKVMVYNRILVKEKDELELFIHEHLREDIDDLYGFKTYDELILFEQLISVNGVGPKAGIAILSCANSDKIVQAIVEENTAFFQAVPGIGKKVAAKIILELKSKLSNESIKGSLSGSLEDIEIVLQALESLGYKGNEAMKIISAMPRDQKIASAEEKIKWCLRNLSKNGRT